jgi:hypothetical protein
MTATTNRGRKSRDTTPLAEATPMDTPEAATAMAALQQDATAHALAVISETGHALAPYSRENALMRLRGFMATASEAMFAVGCELIYIREHETTEDFAQLIAGAGMDLRTAQRTMQAARKFAMSLPEDKTERFALLGKSKMFELLVLDDEDIAALSDGGDVAGMTLDEIDAMSTTELRAKLREEKRLRQMEKETSQRLLDGRNKRIDEQEAVIDRLTNGTEGENARAAAEREAVAVEELASATLEMLGFIQKFDLAIGKVRAIGGEAAEEHAAQTLTFAFQRIAQISIERHMPVDFTAVAVPDWAAGMSDDDLAEVMGA